MLDAILNLARRGYRLPDRFFYHLGFTDVGTRRFFSWFVICMTTVTLLPVPSIVAYGLVVAWMAGGFLAMLVRPIHDEQQSKLFGIGGLMILAGIVLTRTWLADIDATESNMFDGQPVYRIIAFSIASGIGLIGVVLLFAGAVNGAAIGWKKEREEVARRPSETRRQRIRRITLNRLAIPFVAIVALVLALQFPAHAPTTLTWWMVVSTVGLVMVPTIVKSIRATRACDMRRHTEAASPSSVDSNRHLSGD